MKGLFSYFLFSFLFTSAYTQVSVSFQSNIVCSSNPTTLTSLSSTSNGSITEYHWDLDQDGFFDDGVDSSFQYNFSTSTTQSVGLQVITDAPDTAFVYANVQFLQSPTAHFNAANACANSSISFSNNSILGHVFLWNFGDGTFSIENSPLHDYTVGATYDVRLVALDTLNLCTDTFIKPIEVYSLPLAQINVIGDTIVCDNDAAYLEAVSNFPHFWSTGQVLDTISVTSQGWYFLAVVDTFACIGRDSVFISQGSNPTLSLSQDTFIVKGNSIELMVSGANAYQWSTLAETNFNSNPSVVVSPASNTTYFVIGTNNQGCTAIDSVEIVVYENYWIDYTNAVTPNGDGKNDVFYIRNYYMFTGCELNVYDAWGKSRFSTMNIQDTWDANVPSETYYFTLACAKKENSFNGTIHVIK